MTPHDCRMPHRSAACGRDWTRTVFLRGDDEDYTMTTRARLLERIRVTLAGRAAEELVLGDATTYSVKDLRVRRPTN